MRFLILFLFVILNASFKTILVQGPQRIEPLDSFNKNLIYKMSNKFTLNYNNIAKEILLNPEKYANEKIIYIGDSNNKKKYASFNEIINNKNLLKNKKINERLEAFYILYTKELKIFPVKNLGEKYLSINEIYSLLKNNQISIKEAMIYFQIFDELLKALKENNSSELEIISNKLYSIQKSLSITPSKTIINLEIFYNGLLNYKILLILFILFFIFYFTKFYKIFAYILFLAAFIEIILRYIISSHFFSNAYESVIFTMFAMISVGLLLKDKSTLLISYFIAFIFLLFSYITELNPQITQMEPVLNSKLLIFHVTFTIVSYAFLSISSILALLSLYKNNLIEKTSTPLYIGITFLIIGTILGSIWANETWGNYWSWDIKETWSLITILVYITVIHTKIININKKLYALLLFFALFYILMTFIGVNFYSINSLHTYGQNQVPGIWIYIIISGMIIYIFLLLISYKTSTS